MAEWRNWAGNQTAEPTSVLRPTSVQELVDVVLKAASQDQQVKPIGSGHSFTAIGVAPGIQLDMSGLARIVSADHATGLVTVEAGMPLHRLNRELAAQGLAMTNLGDIEVQTISGALSTGTHGTGERFGGLTTQIRGMQLVTADGTLRELDPNQSPDLYEMARLGLGALGVIATVTLQTEPLFAVHAEEKPMPMPEVLDRFDELASAVDHFEFYWFPHTNGTLTKHNTRQPGDVALQPLGRLKRWVDDELLSNTLFGTLQTLERRIPALIRPVNKFSTKVLGARTYTDLSYKIFTSPRRVRFCEMEYAIPRESVVDVLKELDASIERSGMLISFPVEVRVAAADDIPLSTASGRDSAYIAVHMDNRNDHEPYFRLVESIMTNVQGRPHWGKLHYLGRDDFAERYPRFGDFVAIRDRVDPQGRFSNPYLDRVLGPPPGRR